MTSDETRRAALAEVEKGASVTATAKKYGVTRQTINLWKRAARGQGSAATNDTPTLKTQTLPPMPPPSFAEDPRGGYEAAKSAAGLGNAPGSAPSPPSSGALPPTFVTPDDLVQAAEAVTGAVLKTVMTFSGLPPIAELDQLCALTHGEKATLKILAPPAIPHLNELLSKTKENSLYILLGIYGTFLLQRGMTLYRFLKSHPELRGKKNEGGSSVVPGGHGDGENNSRMDPPNPMGERNGFPGADN